jgi:TRAP-type C4-dicarboxylate transport system substrate-binding protein
VQASAPEVRDVMEKGVAQAVTFPWGSTLLFGLDKVSKYHMDASVVTTTFQWLMSPKTYNAMSASQKKVIDAHCTSQWAARFANPWADFERSGLAKMKAEPGQDVYTINAEQLAEWKKSAEPLHQKWAADVKKAGGDPDAIMKDLHNELVKNNATY